MKLKWLKIYMGLLLFLILNSCASLTLPPLMCSAPADFPQEQYLDYDAVYEYDELRIVTEDLYLDQGWNSYFYVNQKLRILNRKGVEYGTVKVYKYSDNLVDFKVALQDPAGNPVPLDLAALRKKYSETGKIIVPKVEPGCQIQINLIFRESNLVYSFEHWFERPIPVLNARFSIYFPPYVHYTCKAYGGVAPAAKQRTGFFYGYTWDRKNIIPEDDMFEIRWHIDREPHVLAAIDRWSFMQYRWKAPDWKGWARIYKEYLLSSSLLASKSNLKKVIDGIVQDKKNDIEKADAILAFVQDQITVKKGKKLNLNAINPNNVLHNKSGDPWEIAVLLKEMFQVAGFSTHTYATQSIDSGGFDPEFPTWRYLMIALPVINLDGRDLIAYPYERLMGLGEYPFSFSGLQGLNLENERIETLPNSIHTKAVVKFLAVLDPQNWNGLQYWDLTYEGHQATRMRIIMGKRTSRERKDFLRSVIGKYDQGNFLEEVDLKTINRSGECHIALKVRNTGFKTEGPNSSHYSLKPYFRKYFSDYDESRKVNYINDINLVLEDSVLIKKTSGTRQTYHFECKKLENALFSSQCKQKETDEGLLLSRKLTVKQAELTPAQMQVIYPDIIKLNRIDESYIIEEFQKKT